jgi:hypothetical protein
MTARSRSGTPDARCSSMHRSEPVDALTEGLAELARYDNTNTNMIVVVSGVLDAARLSAAVTRAAPAFPLLFAGYPPRRIQPTALDIGCLAVSVHRWEGTCDLGDTAFRELLMTLNERNRIDARRRVPFQIYLIAGQGGATSCVYLSSAHAVADAHSDSLLLERIMREYASPDGTACTTARIHDFAPLQYLRPQWYTWPNRALRSVRAAASIARDLMTKDRGFSCPRIAAVPVPQIDFYRSVVDESFSTNISQIAKDAGVTVNTVLVAALVRVIERLNQRSGHVRLICAVSLRFALGDSCSDTFRNYLLPVALRVPADLSNTQLLARVHELVRGARRPANLQLELGRLETLAMLLRIPGLYPLTRRILRRSQGTNACLSNPGVIGENLSSFTNDKSADAVHRVTQYVGFGCLVEPLDFILYTPTVNGRLQFDAVYRRSAFTDIRSQLIDPFVNELRLLLADLAKSGEPLPARE